MTYIVGKVNIQKYLLISTYMFYMEINYLDNAEHQNLLRQ